MLDIIVVPCKCGSGNRSISQEEIGISLWFTKEKKWRMAIQIGMKIMKQLRWNLGDFVQMGPIANKAGYWGIRRAATGLKISKATSTQASARIQGGGQYTPYFPQKNRIMSPVKFEDVEGELLIKIPEE